MVLQGNSSWPRETFDALESPRQSLSAEDLAQVRFNTNGDRLTVDLKSLEYSL